MRLWRCTKRGNLSYVWLSGAAWLFFSLWSGSRYLFKNAKKIKLMDSNNDAHYTVKIVMCLPLLPPNMLSIGFDFINQRLQSNTENQFIAYMHRQWVNKEISVHRILNRTNSFHTVKPSRRGACNGESASQYLGVCERTEINKYRQRKWFLAPKHRRCTSYTTKNIVRAKLHADFKGPGQARCRQGFLRSLCRTMDNTATRCAKL